MADLVESTKNCKKPSESLYFYEVLIDAGETPNKCTIAPLAYRSDFSIHRAKEHKTFGPLHSSILLHHQGEDILSLNEEVFGIASVDCVWRRLDPMMEKIVKPLPRLVRIPDGFKTAYPRKSLNDFDPEGGLATIEAIFTARALLGFWDVTLLSEYYFGKDYVELNRNRFVELGAHWANDTRQLPSFQTRLGNSRQRRLNRGRVPKPSDLKL